MHTFEHGKTGVIINHNADYSGDAKVMVPASLIDGRPLSELVELDDRGNLWINVIPVAALASFSWFAASRQIISTIEDLEDPNETP